ncbi:MAG: biotin/lipoyl-containing protein [Lachnospiraceae bacterium]
MKYAVKLNGKEYEVEVARIDDDFRAMTPAEVNGEIITAPAPKSAAAVSNPVKSAPEPPASSAAGCTVCSPMPGKVFEVKAAVGQKMLAGDVIVIIEAMKMENEIVAPQDGVIDSILVNQGDTVETDTIMAVLK